MAFNGNIKRIGRGVVELEGISATLSSAQNIYRRSFLVDQANLNIFINDSLASSINVDYDLDCKMYKVVKNYTFSAGDPSPDPNLPSTIPPIPDRQISDSGSAKKIPLDQHPNFEQELPDVGKSMKDLWDKDLNRIVDKDGDLNGTDFAGLNRQSSYIVGTYQRTVTEYFNGTPPSIEGDVGRLRTPPGTIGGFDNHWLILTGSTTEPNTQNYYGSRTLVFRFSAKPFPPDPVYPS